MRKLLCSAVVLASLFTICSAQTITETFGSGANAFTMDFVTIGNPNNVADTTGDPNPAGSVAYTYNFGKHEVSRDQINKANAAGSLGITLQDMTSYGGNEVNRPATGISWYEAAKYVNWLNTITGGTAAYKFDGSGNFLLWSAGDAGYNANNLFRNSLAKYVIASRDEWYKGAYGKADGSWSNFPNGTDIAPTAVAGGTDANTAVYGQSASTGPADITSAGGVSAYGTMGHGGNVMEWNETAQDGINYTAAENRELRGSSWKFDIASFFGAAIRNQENPTVEHSFVGFRVASVPEPSSLSLLLVGLAGVASRRLLKRRS